MKTATVTWITYNNYGTLLQAYALQRQIELLGHENVILSDKEILGQFREARTPTKTTTREEVKRRKSRFSRLVDLTAHPGRLSRVLLSHTNSKKYKCPYEDSQSKCEQFKEQKLKILYGQTRQMLPALNEEFDAFIAGSDQVWSVFESIFNPYYYLDFANKRKIAYAPSLGTDRISKEIGEEVRELISDFSALSAREEVSASQLSEISGRDIAWVADPTLLHDKEFWSKFSEDVPARKKKYLLCYFLENKNWYFEYAKKLAHELGLKMVLIPNKWDYLSSEFVTQCGVGPEEFVSLFKHADYVLTDSYHGSIFSIIFEKSFQYLLRFAKDDPGSQNIRIESLFDLLGLRDRVISEDTLSVTELSMQYGPIIEKLAVFREKSKVYLEDCLK